MLPNSVLFSQVQQMHEAPGQVHLLPLSIKNAVNVLSWYLEAVKDWMGITGFS